MQRKNSKTIYKNRKKKETHHYKELIFHQYKKESSPQVVTCKTIESAKAYVSSPLKATNLCETILEEFNISRNVQDNRKAQKRTYPLRKNRPNFLKEFF